MMPTLNKHGIIIFSIIGALLIIVSAWGSRGVEDADTWLYVFSVWMILFSAFEIHSSVKVAKMAKLALAALFGAFAIIVFVWWANGAEQSRLFLTCTAAMLVTFLVLLSQKKKDGGR